MEDRTREKIIRKCYSSFQSILFLFFNVFCYNFLLRFLVLVFIYFKCVYSGILFIGSNIDLIMHSSHDISFEVRP